MDKDMNSGSPQVGEPAPKKSKKKMDAEAGGAGSDGSEPTKAPSGENEQEMQEGQEVQEVEDIIEQETEHLDELAQALADAEEMRDRYLRLKAEWDNYRKRTEAERADERSRATQHLVEKILPVLDDMERAIEHSETAQEESFCEGIAQVYGKLLGVLESEGVRVIDPKGEPFDANLHCAISKAEDNRLPDETVLEVFQKGYVMGSRVLRPASVVVNSR